MVTLEEEEVNTEDSGASLEVTAETAGAMVEVVVLATETVSFLFLVD
jgi:hypothetical protein